MVPIRIEELCKARGDEWGIVVRRIGKEVVQDKALRYRFRNCENNQSGGVEVSHLLRAPPETVSVSEQVVRQINMSEIIMDYRNKSGNDGGKPHHPDVLTKLLNPANLALCP